MNEKVVHLVDRAPGYAVSGQAALIDWALQWLAQLEADGNVRTLVLVVETADGNLYRLSQSIQDFDSTRLIGLLKTLAYRIANGGGKRL